MRNPIPQSKIKAILLLHELGTMNIRGTARSLKISRNTVKKYMNQLDRFKSKSTFADYSIDACLSYIKEGHQSQERDHPLFRLFPSVVENIHNNNSNRLIEWKNYKINYPEGYGYT